jgi:hypothetical protein
MPDSALNFDRPRLTDRSTNPHNSPTPQKGAERAANIPTRGISQLMDEALHEEGDTSFTGDGTISVLALQSRSRMR